MSRIGKKPIAVPKGVKVDIADRRIKAEGPKGTLEFEHRPEVRVSQDNGSISVDVDESLVGDKKVRALWGTTRALVNTMMQGVSQGYERKLQIVGVGWTANVSGKTLTLNVGYANPVKVEIPDGIDVNVQKDIITVSGPSKQLVGQVSAVIRGKRPPEPYNGKGVRYTDEQVRKKEGKQFGKK